MTERLRRIALGAGLFAAALVAAPLVAAAGNALDGASVSPGSGTTATAFQFSVHYSSRQGHAPSKVTASAGGKTVTLSLISGTASDGIYRGSGRLPVGSWNVVFSATVSQGRSPTAAGPTVKVTAPAPTPKPVTLPPAAPAPVAPPPPQPVPPAAVIVPPPAPAPAAPAPAAPVASPRAKPSVARAVAKKASPAAHSAAASAHAIPAPTKDQEQQLSNLMLGGVGVIGLVAAFWFLVAWRRREEPAQEAIAEVVAPTQPRAPPVPAPWAADSQLDDEPIGTVDYLPLGAGEAIGTPPPKQPREQRTNPHAARIQAARNSREMYGR